MNISKFIGVYIDVVRVSMYAGTCTVYGVLHECIAFFSKDVLACVHVRKYTCEQEHSLVSRRIGNYVDRHGASEYVLSPVYSIHR